MIEVKVIPNSKKRIVIKDNEKFKVYVKKPAVDNKANEDAVELLAEFFNVKKSNIKIVKGEKSRNKLIEVLKCCS